jgi:hypothetical protein
MRHSIHLMTTDSFDFISILDLLKMIKKQCNNNFQNFFLFKNIRVLKIIVDSSDISTVPIVIEDVSFGMSKLCGSIQMTGFNKDIRIGEIMYPYPKITILSSSGDPLPKAYVKLDSRFSSDGPTDFPNGILPNLLLEDGYVSNSEGEVILKNFKVCFGCISLSKKKINHSFFQLLIVQSRSIFILSIFR